MKKVVDLNGDVVEVSDDTVVKTIDGVHYLMSDSDIEEREGLELEWEKERRKTQYIHDRQREYPPVGNQLDAIWKQLNARRLKGENLVQDADDMLGKILAVKNKHPKPTED